MVPLLCWSLDTLPTGKWGSVPNFLNFLISREEWKEKYGKRTVVERDFSHAKLHRGLERARYRGLGKLGIQAALTFITENALLMARGAMSQPAAG